MSDIAEFERRIAYALERIGKGAERLRDQVAAASEANADSAAASGADSAEIEQLKQALAEEKTANAQLEERVKAIRQKQDKNVANLEAQIAELTARAQTAEKDLDKLRRATADLRASNTALREANAEGLADAHLINKSMQAELIALRAQQEADRAELDGLIGELSPMVEEINNA